MKTKLLHSILLAVALMAALPASAYDFMVDGLCYNRNGDGTSVTVTNETYYEPRYTSLNGAITIPETVSYSGTTYSVTSIGDEAFLGCYGLTSVTIPNSVTTIGGGAFRYCYGLTSVTIPNSVTSIGYVAFNGCSGLTSVTIGNSVTAIGDWAFAYCSGLTSVTIPNSVTTIGELAFAYCSGLTSVTIGNSVTSIGVWAFAYCRGLTSVTIPNSVTSIGIYAFYECHGLTSVTIGNSVTAIGDWAFCECDGLTSVTIGNSVTSIGDRAFAHCRGLTSVTIPGSVTSIDECAFGGCSGLTNIYCKILNPNNVRLGYNVYGGVDKSSCILTVPAVSLNLYKAAAEWKDFLNIYPMVSSISLNKTQLILDKGHTETLTATVLPNDATNKTLNWTSSNMSVATVDQNGKVTAKAVGSTTITATATDGSDVKATCQVTVIIPVTSITLSQTSATINKGNTLTLTATIQPTNATNKTLSWSSSNTSVATVDQNGKVTAKAAGNATITATATDGSDVSASCQVSVIIPVTSITLSQMSATINKGNSLTLTATIQPTNATNKTLSWSSSNTSVATVDQNGKVTAKAVGSATITATATDGSGKRASCQVTVYTPVSSITMSQSTASIFQSGTLTLTATVSPNDATNKTLSWSSSNTSVATVDQNGKVTAKAAGNATITVTATDGSGVSASCLVTVLPDYSLTITPDVAHVRGSEQRTYELAINMSNRQAISGLQFNMKLPTGVSLATDSYGDYDIWLDNDRKARNHTWGVEPRANNSYFVLISSPTNRTFSGNMGAVLHLTVQIDKFHSSIGDYAITLSDVVMAEADETQHTATSSQSTVRLAYLVGDANADVEVDVADYVVTANNLLGRDMGSHFFTDAANAAYDNSTINVTDLVAITNIALELREKEIKPSVNGYQLAPAVMPPGADYAVTAAVTEASADRTVVTVAVDNDAPLAALQLDLDLPQGVTLERAAVTERATGMDAATGTTPEGKARVILSSFGTQEIAGGGGDALTLTLRGKARVGESLKIGNVTMAERNLIEHLATGDVSLDLNQVSGVGEVSCDRVNIYGRDGAVVIESPVAGTAQLVRMNGMSQTVTVAAGRNVYPVSVTRGDIVIATFNGITAKLQF